MIPILPIILAIVIGPSYLFLKIEPGYLYGLDVYRPPWSPLLALLVSVLPGLLGELLIRRMRARIQAGGEDRVRRSIARVMALYRLSVVLAYVIAVYFLHWPRVIEDLGVTGWVLVDKIVVLLPFAISLLAAWVTTHRVQCLLGVATSDLTGYLMFQIRLTSLPILPLGLAVLLVDIVENTEPLRRLFIQFPYLMWISVLVYLMVIFLFMPTALRYIWTVKPLPDGPLRRELEGFSRELGFTCRNILVWGTQWDLMNAAIIGLVGPLRYVLLTDGLVKQLSTTEIKAVFAHEVGHAKRKHLFFYLVFSISFIFLFLSVEENFAPQGKAASDIQLLLFVALWVVLFIVYWWLLLGFISRRFESEADLYGSGAVGDPEIFIRALEKISELSGNVRTKRSWRHFSVAQRVNFLRDFHGDGVTQKRFRRTVRLMMAGFWLLTAAAIGLGIFEIRRQHIYGLAQRHFEAKELADAEVECRRAIEVGGDDVRYWQLLGRILEGQGRVGEAREAYQTALDRLHVWDTEARAVLQVLLERLGPAPS